MIDTELLSILRAPVGGATLTLRDGRLVSDDGAQGFPIVSGVPVLLAPGRTLFGAPDPTRVRAGPSSAAARVRASVRRRLTESPRSRENFAHLQQMLADGADAPRRVLVVGGGILGFGMERFAADPDLRLVETDVYLGPRTKVLCDAHDLPFAGGSFDAVVIQAVLEHVADPVRVVAEIHRVLAPGGLLYSEIPFMQQVHEGAYDFTRFTLGGHRRLLREFTEIAGGAVGGPGEALAWSIAAYLGALAGSERARALLRGAVTIATLPLRWSDRALRDRPAAVDAASGTWLLARRAEVARSDAEIVAAYAGTGATPVRRG